MTTRRVQASIVFSITLCFLILTSLGAAQARIVRPRSTYTGADYGSGGQGTEIVLEAGMVMPFNDLKDDFWTTEKGLSATTGYELGARLRQYLGYGWAISPSFHYVNFGNATGVGDFPQGDDLAYVIDTSLFRYGVELHIFAGAPGAPIRPFLIGGAAFIHYRYRDSLQYNGIYQTSFNAPGFTAGLGFKMKSFEISGTYHFCQFDTDKLPPFSGQQETYLWNHAIVRVGLAFGN